jgi:hypothetical protein
MRSPMIALACLILYAPTDTRADTATGTNEQIFASAEAAFRQGVENKTRILQARKHFVESTDAYVELHRCGVRSPTLYLNLGNAALLADRWPEAIWAYHVGLRLDPNDLALREHLAFARAKVLYPPAGQGRLQTDTWPAWLHRPTIRELSCVLAVFYLLTWLFGNLAFISRRSRFFLTSVSLIVVTAITGVGLWYELRQAEIDRRTPLVILADNAEFYRGNGISYPQHAVLPVLPRGLEVRQLHRRGAWLQIRLSTGEIGWVQSANVLIVGP